MVVKRKAGREEKRRAGPGGSHGWVCARNRTYVKVVLEIDETGYMKPRAILWEDGRRFRISEVLEFRPAYLFLDDAKIDSYLIRVCGQERVLYFEYLDPRFTGRLGRWFVEKQDTEKAELTLCS